MQGRAGGKPARADGRQARARGTPARAGGTLARAGGTLARAGGLRDPKTPLFPRRKWESSGGVRHFVPPGDFTSQKGEASPPVFGGWR
jgi:hypothetical protein